MRKFRLNVVTRFLVALFAGAILIAPLAGIAHAAEHASAVDSADCGTCHWSKNAVATVSTALSLGIPTTTELVRISAPKQPDLQLAVFEQHTRGPPAARV